MSTATKVNLKKNEINHIESERINDGGMKEVIQNTNQYQAQSSVYLGTKVEQSFTPTEIQPNPQSIIEMQKLSYIQNFNAFSQMHLVETLASLKPLNEKLQLLEQFTTIYQQMIQSLFVIQKTILQTTFDGFEISSIDQNIFNELIYKDVKTLEGIHLELIQGTSLRYLQTVANAQNINLNVDLQCLDIKAWSQTCLSHLFKSKITGTQNSNIKKIPISQRRLGVKVFANYSQVKRTTHINYLDEKNNNFCFFNNFYF